MQNYHLKNRPSRELTSEAEIQKILRNGKYSVISMCRDNEPYIVTLSYGYEPETNTLYFHCAKQGLKLDFIAINPTVCATIIEDGGYIQNECEHRYTTAVFWGHMSVISDPEEKKHAMSILLNHLETSPDVIQRMILKSDDAYSRMEILKLEITQIHAKSGQ